jgi:tRNA 5-methylaminomethyl-2-thiouridine biosynthesis bifunctional protein
VAERPYPVTPATPAFDAGGTPWSPAYGDVYHSADSGPGQAAHVFLGGNDLPARWAGARVFTIVETGFGVGLNFLATWQAWRAGAARPERLHFVSIEKHPFLREGLEGLHARYPEFAACSAELRAAWPLPLPGLHRLHFEGGRVTLTLAFGDVADVLPRLRLGADAFFLDGFAPERNPDMWTPGVMKALARLARPGATAATYTAARSVRDALAAAGFAPELRPGFGRKRSMLAARHAPRGTRRAASPAPPQWGERRAIVIGAGLAGAALCERLAARGWDIALVERRPAPAMEASGIATGIFHPHVSRDDSILSRLTRAGSLYALRHWRALEAAGRRFAWASCGALQMAKDGKEEARMAATVRALGFPAAYVDYLPRASACDRAGIELRAGGWWFPDGGWMRPAELVGAQIVAAGAGGNLHLRTGIAVHTLRRDGENWLALSGDGAVIASAPVVVLANAEDAARLAAPGAPLKRVRGQLSLLPGGHVSGLRAVLAGAGHLAPAADGTAVAGATYDFDDENAEPREEGHAGNLARLEKLLPGASAGLDPARLGGSVGFRCVATDRLPLMGAMPDSSPALPGIAPSRRGISGVSPKATGWWEAGAAGARDVPRVPGLYGLIALGSRGLTWAALGAELVACAIEGEPPPLEGDLLDATDPRRFALRRLRRGKG